MKLSYFCRHCGEHLRKGDHRECRVALRESEAREREFEKRRQEQRDPVKKK